MSFPCKRESRLVFSILDFHRNLPDSVTPAEAGVHSSVANMDSRRSVLPSAFIGGRNDGRSIMGKKL